MSMEPIQIVIDTNIVVSAARSRRGTSFELLSMLDTGAFKINLSQALILEYEEKLKQLAKPKGPEALALVDRFLDYLISMANTTTVPVSLRDGAHEADQFVLDLAVASRARFIVTYNKRHYVGAGAYGVEAIAPYEFLRFLGDMQ
ncbi:MAG: putative toxin-antitoxin system toxin component, PIN family [Verrucomicrobia bacterium]|nr:putative toxin-antitoxin system toxin component, PIN family [Verrucomicrobiota bacterium]